MSFVYYNPNPEKILVGDCVIRAICRVTETSWEDVYVNVCTQGLLMKDMPSSNNVWGAYLRTIGYIRTGIPNTCPDCYTVKEFCSENQNGRFILATGSHVIAVVDGNYYDTWDSGDEVPMYFWQLK